MVALVVFAAGAPRDFEFTNEIESIDVVKSDSKFDARGSSHTYRSVFITRYSITYLRYKRRFKIEVMHFMSHD